MAPVTDRQRIKQLERQVAELRADVHLLRGSFALAPMSETAAADHEAQGGQDETSTAPPTDGE